MPSIATKVAPTRLHESSPTACFYLHHMPPTACFYLRLLPFGSHAPAKTTSPASTPLGTTGPAFQSLAMGCEAASMAAGAFYQAIRVA